MATVLSCIMPVCDGAAAHLEAAVESILAQSWPYFELVLVDAATEDGSARLCDGFGMKDPRVQVKHLPQPGRAAAFAAGLALAQGRILCFADPQEEFVPGAFARLIPAFEDRGRDVLSCDFDWLTPDGTVQPVRYPDTVLESTGELWPRLLDLYQAGLLCSLCGKAVRSSLLLPEGPRLSDGPAEFADRSFWLECLAAAHSIEHLSQPLCTRRQPDAVPEDAMDRFRTINRQMREFFTAHGQQQFYPAFVAERLPEEAERYFDHFLDDRCALSKEQRSAGLARLFSDELWCAALLNRLETRPGTRGKLQRRAVRKKKPGPALFSMHFKPKA